MYTENYFITLKFGLHYSEVFILCYSTPSQIEKVFLGGFALPPRPPVKYHVESKVILGHLSPSFSYNPFNAFLQI